MGEALGGDFSAVPLDAPLGVGEVVPAVGVLVDGVEEVVLLRLGERGGDVEDVADGGDGEGGEIGERERLELEGRGRALHLQRGRDLGGVWGVGGEGLGLLVTDGVQYFFKHRINAVVYNNTNGIIFVHSSSDFFIISSLLTWVVWVHGLAVRGRITGRRRRPRK